MKYLSTLGAATALVNSVAGHYIWTQLDIDGQTGVGADGGIRPNSNYNSPVVGKLNRISNSESAFPELTYHSH
jgi:hypothetical protein